MSSEDLMEQCVDNSVKILNCEKLFRQCHMVKNDRQIDFQFKQKCSSKFLAMFKK